MELLKELFSSINLKLQGDKEQKYLNGIVNDQWTSNEEAGKFIWPKTSEKNRQVYLSRLKKNVLEQTIETTLSTKGKNINQAVHFDCLRRMVAINILNSLGVRKGSNWLAKQTIRKAINYDLTEIVLSLSRILEITESVSGTLKGYNYYSTLVDEYDQIFAAENKAIRCFTRLSSCFANSKANTKESIQLAKEFSEELTKDLDRFTSYRYTYYTYHIKATYAQLTNNHLELEKVCRQAIDFFASKPYPIPRAVRFSFTFKPISASLQLKKYSLTEKYINAGLEISELGSYNRIICLIYQAILGFHSKQLNLVKDAIRRSGSHRKYQVVEEQWKIIEAYAHFLDMDTGRKFRVKRFLNEVPIYSKDKRGNNISILILQILFHLKANNKEAIIDKMEALKVYSYRYLKKDETFRSNCFIHILLCLPKAHFNAIALERHAKVYLERLSTHVGEELEIIPFEQLWEEVLKLLEPKK